MPAKKKRPLLKSYAEGVPSVSAKTKEPTELQVTKDLASALKILLDDANAELAKANELLKSGKATMMEHARVVTELSEVLRMKDLVLWNVEGNIRELAAEHDWWQGEAASLRSELLALIRDEAQAHQARGGRELMPAKKARPSKTKRPTDRQTIKDLADALLLVTQVSGATRAELAKAKEQLEKGEATMLENAKVVAELTAALAAKDKELASDARAFAAIDGERTFLWEEIDRFRNRVMDYIRWEMLLPEDARVSLNKVRAQEFEDKLDDDARGES